MIRMPNCPISEVVPFPRPSIPQLHPAPAPDRRARDQILYCSYKKWHRAVYPRVSNADKRPCGSQPQRQLQHANPCLLNRFCSSISSARKKPVDYSPRWGPLNSNRRNFGDLVNLFLLAPPIGKSTHELVDPVTGSGVPLEVLHRVRKIRLVWLGVSLIFSFPNKLVATRPCRGPESAAPRSQLGRRRR